MKKLIYFIPIVILIFGIIIVISVLNKKLELKIDSFDHSSSISFGKQKVSIQATNDLYSSITYKCEDSDYLFNNEIRNSEYYVMDYTYANREYIILLNDGYYYYAYKKDDTIKLNNFVDSESVYHFASYWGPALNGLFFNAQFNEDYTIKKGELTWEELTEEDNVGPFNIDSKEKLISFYKSINSKLCYYNEEEDVIYFNKYKFTGWVSDGVRMSTDWPMKISFSETGLIIETKV